MTVEVQGLPELLNKMKQLGMAVTDIKKDVINEMDNAAMAMKRHCPKNSGKLKEAITVKDKSKGEELQIACGIFADSTINYAIYVEYGTGLYAENGMGRKDPWVFPLVDDGGLTFRWTVGMHPQPFIRPGWDEEKQNVYDGVKQAIIRRIQQIT